MIKVGEETSKHLQSIIEGFSSDEVINCDELYELIGKNEYHNINVYESGIKISKADINTIIMTINDLLRKQFPAPISIGYVAILLYQIIKDTDNKEFITRRNDDLLSGVVSWFIKVAKDDGVDEVLNILNYISSNESYPTDKKWSFIQTELIVNNILKCEEVTEDTVKIIDKLDSVEEDTFYKSKMKEYLAKSLEDDYLGKIKMDITLQCNYIQINPFYVWICNNVTKRAIHCCFMDNISRETYFALNYGIHILNSDRYKLSILYEVCNEIISQYNRYTISLMEIYNNFNTIMDNVSIYDPETGINIRKEFDPYSIEA